MGAALGGILGLLGGGVLGYEGEKFKQRREEKKQVHEFELKSYMDAIERGDPMVATDEFSKNFTKLLGDKEGATGILAMGKARYASRQRAEQMLGSIIPGLVPPSGAPPQPPGPAGGPAPASAAGPAGPAAPAAIPAPTGTPLPGGMTPGKFKTLSPTEQADYVRKVSTVGAPGTATRGAMGAPAAAPGPTMAGPGAPPAAPPTAAAPGAAPGGPGAAAASSLAALEQKRLTLASLSDTLPEAEYKAAEKALGDQIKAAQEASKFTTGMSEFARLKGVDLPNLTPGSPEAESFLKQYQAYKQEPAVAAADRAEDRYQKHHAQEQDEKAKQQAAKDATEKAKAQTTYAQKVRTASVSFRNSQAAAVAKYNAAPGATSDLLKASANELNVLEQNRLNELQSAAATGELPADFPMPKTTNWTVVTGRGRFGLAGSSKIVGLQEGEKLVRDKDGNVLGKTRDGKTMVPVE